MRRAAVITLAFALSGCGAVFPRLQCPTSTEPVEVEVLRDRYVRIDPALTEQVPVPGPEKLESCGIALAAAKQRAAAVEACNAKLKEIEAVQGQPK